jgi:hypothetical protein
MFFFCIEAIEELILLQGIGAGGSISRTIVLATLSERFPLLRIRGFERLIEFVRCSE